MMNQKNIQPGWCDGCNPDNCSGCATPAAPAQAGEQNHLPLAIISAPERIWLDLGVNPYEEDAHFSNLHDLTWSRDNATGDGIEYVRADLAAQTQALTVENEILHAENESLRASFDTLRAGYDAARLEIESLQKAATDRHALQAAGAHPAPCARYCAAQAFRITLRNLQAENEQLRTCNKDAQHEIANLQESMSKTATDLLRESYDDVIQGSIPDSDDPWHGYPWFENTRAALATPAQAAALVSPSDDGFMAAVNEMDGLYAAPAPVDAENEIDLFVEVGLRERLDAYLAAARAAQKGTND